MILTPQMVGVQSPAAGEAYVKPNLLYNYEFDGVNIIESVSGTDTGANWGTSYSPSAPVEYFGVQGWRINHSVDAPTVDIGSSVPVYAFAIELLWYQTSPITYISALQPISIGPLQVRLGTFSSALTNELISLYSAIPSANRRAYCSNTDSIALSSEPAVILFAWDGTDYNVFYDGEKKSTIDGTGDSGIPLSSASSISFNPTNTDYAFGPFAIWTSQLSDSEAVAIVSNYREAIAQ